MAARPHDPTRPTGVELNLSEHYPTGLAPGEPRIWIRIEIVNINDPQDAKHIALTPEEAEAVGYRLIAMAAKAVS